MTAEHAPSCPNGCGATYGHFYAGPHHDEGCGFYVPGLTTETFAALCRERCERTAQGHDGLPCGGRFMTDDGEAFGFCGPHMAVAIGTE